MPLTKAHQINGRWALQSEDAPSRHQDSPVMEVARVTFVWLDASWSCCKSHNASLHPFAIRRSCSVHGGLFQVWVYCSMLYVAHLDLELSALTRFTECAKSVCSIVEEPVFEGGLDLTHCIATLLLRLLARKRRPCSRTLVSETSLPTQTSPWKRMSRCQQADLGAVVGSQTACELRRPIMLVQMLLTWPVVARKHGRGEVDSVPEKGLAV
eukprot:5548714-Amphidinium_carterae.1